MGTQFVSWILVYRMSYSQRDSKACQGMFVWFSTEHSSLVPFILNFCNDSVSQQYHVMFGDKFHTIPSLHSPDHEIDDIFGQLFNIGHD